MSITDPRPAIGPPLPNQEAPSGPDSLGGHEQRATHAATAAEGPSSPQAIVSAMPNDLPPAGDQNTLGGQEELDAQMGDAAEGPFSPQARGSSVPTADAPGLADTLDDFPGGHRCRDTQRSDAAGEQTPPAARRLASPIHRSLLADPLLALAADVLDDLERVRIANENRLRQLTRSVEDADGETRGFGLDESHPDVARLAALVGMLGEAEHKAELNLGRIMRQHRLGPWVAAQKGIGPRQGPRLITAIGDPYIRPEIVLEDGTVEPPRPRTVSELWAYCGLVPGQRRKRGERATWSAAAKMRAWNISVSMLKAGNREVYDKRKARTEGALHAGECVRCGPSGKPAQPGTPWSDAHRHADALRIVSKEVLKELWREARRIHLETPGSGHTRDDTHTSFAADGT